MNNEHDAPFEAALERLLQGEPEPLDGEFLVAAMRQSSESTRMMRQALVMDDLLRQEGQPDTDAFVDALVMRMQGEEAPDEAFVQRVQQAALPSRKPLLVYVALAAAVLVTGALVWHWLPVSKQVTEVVVVPREKVEPAARAEVEPMPSSDELVQLEAGTQDYSLPSGVAVQVAAPAALRFVDDMFVDLQSGRFSADAGATTKGFTVQTAQARVVDLGTRFGVHAGGEQTEVAVFEGIVRVESRATASLITLKAGEALTVGEQGEMIRLTGLVTGERWQDWSTQGASAITSVVTSGKADAFCRLVPKGFKAGALVYAGAPLRWESAGEMPFPKALIGADLVQAPQQGGRDEDWRMTLKLGRPATVYVFSSKSAPPPVWLAKSFTSTGQQVAATELLNPERGKPARVQMKAVFDVWKRTVRQPGSIELGPPARQKDGKPTAMYGVAAQLLH